jgi:hypothetical protein
MGDGCTCEGIETKTKGELQLIRIMHARTVAPPMTLYYHILRSAVLAGGSGCAPGSLSVAASWRGRALGRRAAAGMATARAWGTGAARRPWCRPCQAWLTRSARRSELRAPSCWGRHEISDRLIQVNGGRSNEVCRCAPGGTLCMPRRRRSFWRRCAPGATPCKRRRRRPFWPRPERS